MRFRFPRFFVQPSLYGGSFAVAAELIGDTIEQVAKTYAHVYGDDAERIVLSL